ncbi:MAG: class I SAM-dependent methyltransferase [Pseudomonadota bacterium]|jgi:SAM-dependent methyltransferase|nr:class I SAM-dependent methyltransferase [Pseudomonadota bacterium]
MERVVYSHMADLDQRHWWYLGRRRVLASLIDRLARPPAGGRILEVGCGTGHNLAMLRQFAEVDAVELDESVRAIAESRLGRQVMSDRLPELTGVADRNYDLIAALDVIEHISDDTAALQAIARKLRPGGKLVITVPAHPWMWSAHDVINHHKRRYSKAGLATLVDDSPLRLEAIGYLNSLLFPLAVAQRLASKLARKEDSRLGIPPGPINALLTAVFAAERHAIGRLPLPPGLSLFAVASAGQG